MTDRDDRGGYCLVGVSGAGHEMRFRISGPLRVGRGLYNHLVLDDASVSRQHARLEHEAEGCVLYDLNSANRTFVNGIAVSRHVLAPRDVVAFGNSVFRVEWEAHDATPGAGAEAEEPTLTGSTLSGPESGRFREKTLLQAHLRHDLALAAQIQKSFLPREVIAVEGLELFAEYRAAYAVGGDFYDVFWVAPGRLAVFIGDISGKGVAGALLMARVSSELRAAALAHIEPQAVLTAMNRATLARQQAEEFFTAIYLTLNVQTGEILLGNAGHPLPYWQHADGRIEPITRGRGCAVGILDEPGFAVASLRLEQGDSLVLYTDGVIEAASADGTFYGQARLEECLARQPWPRAPKATAEDILRSVDRHSERGPVNDDLTLFICQRCAGTAPTMQPRRRSSRFPAPPVDEPATNDRVTDRTLRST